MYLGIDFGGSHIKYGLVANKVLVAAQQFSISGYTFDALMQETAARVQRLLSEQGVNEDAIQGITIALPGVVNFNEGTLLSLPKGKYEGALGFDFKAWAKAAFGQEADLFNDAHLALLGEVYAGAAEGCKDVTLIIIGTGIGSGVMMNGRLLSSRNYTAGNLGGHFLASVSGQDCICGSKGCTETQASNWALDNIAREKFNLEASKLAGYSKIDYRAVFDHYENDTIARQLGDHLITHWSHAVINHLHAYDSEVVVLSGSVFNSQVNILEKISEYVRNNVWLPANSFTIRVAKDPTNSVLLGAESKLNNYYRI